LGQAGLHWISPSAELAHPLDDGIAVTLERDVGGTAPNWARVQLLTAGSMARSWPIGMACATIY
jgi:hypothetical protein